MGSESNGLSSSSLSSSSWSPAMREMVRKVKEVVKRSDDEICVALLDCDMNPDDAVQRLLSQGCVEAFRQVKSKRERRKEMKEMQETRTWVSNNPSKQSNGLSGSIPSSNNENGNSAPVNKGENTFVASSPPHPYFTSSTLHSDSTSTENGRQSVRVGDVTSSTAQPALGYQPASTRYISMADIVKNGKPTSKGSHDMHPQTATNEAWMVNGSEYTVSQNSFPEDRTVVRQPTAAGGSWTLEEFVVADSDKYSKHSNGDLSKPYERSPPFDSDYLVTTSVSSGEHKSASNAQETDSFSNFSDQNTLSNDVVALSSSMQQLDLGKDPKVIFPSHLQALAANCPRLMFGTFAPTVPLHSDTTIDVSSTGVLNTRNIGNGVDESLDPVYNTHKATTGSSYNFAPSSDESSVSKYFRPYPRDVESNGLSTEQLPLAMSDPVVRSSSVQSQPAVMESQANGEYTSKHNQVLSSRSTMSSHDKDSIPSFSNTPAFFPEAVQARPPLPNPISSSSLPSITPNQHHAAQSYAQHHRPEPQRNNGMSYPGLNHNYSQLLSSIQQQSFPARDDLLRYLSMENHPQYRAYLNRAAEASNFARYRASTNVPGSYPVGSLSPTIANNGYNSDYGPQYSDRNSVASRPQSGSSSSWNDGSDSRMQPSAQDSDYYNLLAQNEQYARYRQNQQRPSQYNGSQGYPGHYQSQPEVARDPQQQNFDNPSSPLQRQFWQQR